MSHSNAKVAEAISEAEIMLRVQTIVAEGLRTGVPPQRIGEQLTDMLEEFGGIGTSLTSDSWYIRYVAKEVLELDGRHN